MPLGLHSTSYPVLWQGLLPLSDLKICRLERYREHAFQITGVSQVLPYPGLRSECSPRGASPVGFLGLTPSLLSPLLQAHCLPRSWFSALLRLSSAAGSTTWRSKWP